LRQAHGSCKCSMLNYPTSFLCFVSFTISPGFTCHSLLPLAYWASSAFVLHPSVLPSFLHGYVIRIPYSESSTLCPIINPFMVWSLSFICASSLAPPLAIIVGALFFFPFTPSSCLAVFSTDPFLQGVHQKETSDSCLCVTDISRTHTALNMVDSALRHEHKHDQRQKHEPFQNDSPHLAWVSLG
jgi:hypothetical protein